MSEASSISVMLPSEFTWYHWQEADGVTSDLKWISGIRLNSLPVRALYWTFTDSLYSVPEIRAYTAASWTGASTAVTSSIYLLFLFIYSGELVTSFLESQLPSDF